MINSGSPVLSVAQLMARWLLSCFLPGAGCWGWRSQPCCRRPSRTWYWWYWCNQCSNGRKRRPLAPGRRHSFKCRLETAPFLDYFSRKTLVTKGRPWGDLGDQREDFGKGRQTIVLQRPRRWGQSWEKVQFLMNPTVHYTQISVFNTCVCVHGQVKAVLYEVSVLANKK